MLYVWLAIILGVVLVPIIASYTKELENKISPSGGSLKTGANDEQNQKKAKKMMKIMTYLLIGIFITVALVMIIFISGNISQER